MERSKRTVTLAIIFLVLIHEVGILGFHLPETTALFEQLVPYNLLLSTILLGFFHRAWTLQFGVFCFVVFWAGYLVELAGVSTGVIFGPYHYETSLGIKIGGVPPMIGVNWLLVVYMSSMVAQYLVENIWVRTILSGVLVVLLDALIEPMATTYHLWTWDTLEGSIPFQNYAAWFVIGGLMAFGFHSLNQEKSNPLALPLYVIQLLFFLSFLIIGQA